MGAESLADFADGRVPSPGMMATTRVDDFVDSMIQDSANEIPEEDSSYIDEEITEAVINTLGEESVTPVQEAEPPVVVVEAVPETAISWTFPLAQVPAETPLLVREHDQAYQYKRIVDPSGIPTNKFNVFCKEASDPIDGPWSTLAGVLSDKYVVASLEQFLAVLNSQMNIEHNVVYKEPFHVNWIGSTPNAITMFDTEEAKMFFGILTGVTIEEIDSIASTMSVLVTNTYDGSKSLRVDYIVKTAAVGNTFQDYFTLCNLSHNIIHSRSLSQIAADVSNMQAQIDPIVAILKAYTNPAEIGRIINNLAGCFKKAQKQMFNGICEGLAAEYKSLFNILILASIVLSQSYAIDTHNRLRSVVDKLYQSIFEPVA